MSSVDRAAFAKNVKPRMTDAHIEDTMKALGAKWNGNVWTIEDADLHPLVRSISAPAPVAHRLEGWQSIETAPKDVVYKEGNHSYGEKILVATRAEVLRARWWFHADGSSNFIQDGGAACFPSHWMELPQLPDQGARNEQR